MISMTLNLGINGFRYEDLYDTTRLFELALEFDRFLDEQDHDLFTRFDAWRGGVGALTAPE